MKPLNTTGLLHMESIYCCCSCGRDNGKIYITQHRLFPAAPIHHMQSKPCVYSSMDKLILSLSNEQDNALAVLSPLSMWFWIAKLVPSLAGRTPAMIEPPKWHWVECGSWGTSGSHTAISYSTASYICQWCIFLR